MLLSQAEAFAALVQMGLIAIPGAVKTVVALLKKPDNRSAANTMMGKTAELCYDQVHTMWLRLCHASGVGGEHKTLLVLCQLSYISTIQCAAPPQEYCACCACSQSFNDAAANACP